MPNLASGPVIGKTIAGRLCFGKGAFCWIPIEAIDFGAYPNMALCCYGINEIKIVLQAFIE